LGRRTSRRRIPESEFSVLYVWGGKEKSRKKREHQQFIDFLKKEKKFYSSNGLGQALGGESVKGEVAFYPEVKK